MLIAENQKLEANNYPRDIETFVDSPWFKKIKKTVLGFHLNEDIEDTMQEILLLLHQKNYLAKWDPKKGGSFANWIYTFVIRLCMLKRIRSFTRGGRAIEGAVSLFSSLSKDDSEAYLYSSIMDESSENPELLSEVSEICEIMEAKLSTPEFKAYSSNSLDGVVYQRDCLTAFKLAVYGGLSHVDIARKFNTSTTFVNLLFAKIRVVFYKSIIFRDLMIFLENF